MPVVLPNWKAIFPAYIAFKDVHVTGLEMARYLRISSINIRNKQTHISRWYYIVTMSLYPWLQLSDMKSSPHILVPHIWVSELGSIGSDNSLSPVRRQVIIWTNTDFLLIGLIGTDFSDIWIETQYFSFMKMHLKMSCAKWRPSCAEDNRLNQNIGSNREDTWQWSLDIFAAKGLHCMQPYPEKNPSKKTFQAIYAIYLYAS